MENKKQEKTLLLAEDDKFVSDIYTRKFEQEGYNVIVAENGIEVTKKIKEKRPDLILLDIVMPYMDGREVLKKIKSDENFKSIPVMMLTNLSEKDEVDEDIANGADAYIIKSHFSPSEVVKKVEELLK